MKNTFSHYHPAAVFLYISCAIVTAMMTYTPYFVAVSFVCACICSVYLNGLRRFLRGLRILIPLLLLLIIITPLANQRGMTVLFMIFDRPITLEAIVYSMSMGGMLVSVFIWFQCYQKLITNDKFMFLFARFAPTSAMVVSMITKFIPVTSLKFYGIRDARKSIGGSGSKENNKGYESISDSKTADFKNPEKAQAENSGKTVMDKPEKAVTGKTGKLKTIRDGIGIVSILMSRCLEDSIETADSMRARGYGTCKRTVFAASSIYARDIISICICSGLFLLCSYAIIMPEVKPNFFPFLDFGYISPVTLLLYAVMLLWPLLIELKDELIYFVRYR